MENIGVISQTHTRFEQYIENIENVLINSHNISYEEYAHLVFYLDSIRKLFYTITNLNS